MGAIQHACNKMFGDGLLASDIAKMWNHLQALMATADGNGPPPPVKFDGAEFDGTWMKPCELDPTGNTPRGSGAASSGTNEQPTANSPGGGQVETVET